MKLNMVWQGFRLTLGLSGLRFAKILFFLLLLLHLPLFFFLRVFVANPYMHEIEAIYGPNLGMVEG